MNLKCTSGFSLFSCKSLKEKINKNFTCLPNSQNYVIQMLNHQNPQISLQLELNFKGQTNAIKLKVSLLIFVLLHWNIRKTNRILIDQEFKLLPTTEKMSKAKSVKQRMHTIHFFLVANYFFFYFSFVSLFLFNTSVVNVDSRWA